MANTLPILVVDDSATQLEVLRDALEDRGYRVLTASNGIEAIGQVQACPPALILSDVLMPELNGYHLCRLLKNDPATAIIPIILLTNLRERHDRFWGEKAGADCYLEKTGDLSPILEAIDRLALDRPPEPAPGKRVEGDIQSRLTRILDRLLYESTISNEIRKLTGLAHDSDQLVSEFLRFLAVISRHSAAALLIGDGRDKHLLAIHRCEPLSGEDMELIHQHLVGAAGGRMQLRGQIRQLVLDAPLPEDEAIAAAAGSPLAPLATLPIAEGEETLAHLALFHRGGEPPSDGLRHALQTVADRFLIVARFLLKTKETEQVKADFVSMLVHDLRAPLTSIRGFTNVLAEGVYGGINEEQATALVNIENGCDRLLSLIEDILDLSKLEAGKLQIYPSPMQLGPLVERAIHELRALFQEKTIEVRLEIGQDTPYALADGKQIFRVLANLLSNAVKFTPEGGRVVISAFGSSSCRPDTLESCLQVSITDSGEGIPPDLQDILFGRFQQLPSRGMFRKGTGLGLAICREIVHLHGGEIWVESPLSGNGGSRFSFTLPLAD